MTTLRFLIILLVLLNLLAFAAVKGWLGFEPPRGEPERITNQLHPERIRMVGEPAASRPPAQTTPPPPAPPSQPPPALPAPLVAEPGTPAQAVTPAPAPAPAPVADSVCVYWSGLNASDADRLTALLVAAGADPRQSSAEAPSSWWVRIPPQGSREAAERRVRELRAQGVADLFIVQDPGPNQFAISLGLFKTEASSNQHLAQLRAKGVRGAGVSTRGSVEYRVEVTAGTSELEAALADEPLASRRTPCSP